MACDSAPELDSGVPAADASSSDASSSDAGSSDAASSDAGEAMCIASPERSGEGTYYDADGSGNCGFPATPDDLMVAALNDPDYDNAAWCGACAAVTGPIGEVTVRIVDRCPECASGDLDLSPQAFDAIAVHADGRVPITWRVVPCEIAGPIVYHFKDGSNPWWTAIQVRNHRHPIARLEASVDGAWRELGREQYNYFVDASGLGEGPFTLRVTDVHGNVIEDSGIPLLDDADAPGASQLPACL